MIKTVLRNIFCMCKTMVNEVNENIKGIIEMKCEMGIHCDPYHELPEFDDPFEKWNTKDVQDAQGGEEEEPAPPTRTISHRACDDDEETEGEEPLQYREYDDDDEE
ncbi:actin-like protein ARP8 [Panicum miliaceum]|uniref:Actin-like protein ARP8 n=1 Tax=Panicum miliaceum TaxID=4540 RepID=A0A3L6TQ98_PANMI|nr:actin-like protein ARP8 [Panicum miliaceum]